MVWEAGEGAWQPGIHQLTEAKEFGEGVGVAAWDTLESRRPQESVAPNTSHA